MTEPLAGRTALVTGATRGLGDAIARRLLADGARVIGTGSTPEGSAPDGCEYRAVDFGDTAATEAFAAEAVGWDVDVLVNNAGINKVASFAEIDGDDFDRIQRVNVRAPFLLSRAVVPGMRRRGWGRIVNLGSIFGTVSKAQRGSYSASKFAVDGLTAALAAEVAVDGVLVNTVSPGVVETDLTLAMLGEDGMRELAQQIPMRRLAQPDEIAAFIAWLVGPENTYVSGQNLLIDGGFVRV